MTQKWKLFYLKQPAILFWKLDSDQPGWIVIKPGIWLIQWSKNNSDNMVCVVVYVVYVFKAESLVP